MTSSDAAATEPGLNTKIAAPVGDSDSDAVPTPHEGADAPITRTESEPKSEPAAEPTQTPAPVVHSDGSDSRDQEQQDYNYPHPEYDEHDLPSPPTVSPLSTPAATQVNVGDNVADDDIPDIPDVADRCGPQAVYQAFEAMGLAELLGNDLTDRQSEAVATTDPEPRPKSLDYTSPLEKISNIRRSQSLVDQNAYMMSIAQATTRLFQPLDPVGPAVVAPSEVSLQASLTQESDILTASGDFTSASASPQLESFAKLEFADSVFQITTYAVIIGRDQRAMEQARRDEKREASYRRKVEENARNGLPPPTPFDFDRGKFSKSYVSEEGGILGPESDGDDGDDEIRPAKRRRISPAKRSLNGDDGAQNDHVKSNRQYISHTLGAAAVDLGTLQPSPSHIPFVGIHSPGPDIAIKTRGISRQHLKIQFNERKSVFEAVALHKNGFFCDDALYGFNDPVVLRSGDRIQIKDVEFRFLIKGVQNGKTGGEEVHEEEASSRRMSIGGKEMSLDFDHSDLDNFQDTPSELSEVEAALAPAVRTKVKDEQDEDDTDRAALREQASYIPETREGDPNLLLEYGNVEIPRRRGPGRPPKDGIMSKRERRLLKKQSMETSRKTLPQDPQNDKIKRPVGRPRKNPAFEDGEQQEKRKYSKRKPKEEGAEGSDGEKRPKEKKDKKVRPKSPPLELVKEDFTEEQLQKPTKNYSVLIDEALTNGPPDGLTLKQIYKRIQQKYPWFFFFSETKGWESSVRHNLIGNDAFRKDEITGLWCRVPGIELEAGKKRKANSPDRLLASSHLHAHLHQPQHYRNGSHYPSSPVGFGQALPAYATDTKHPQSSHQNSAGQAIQPGTTAPAVQHVPQQAYAAQGPAPAQLPPGYGVPALARQPAAAQTSTYNSPYARPPPPSKSSPPIKSEPATETKLQAPSVASSYQASSQSRPHPQQKSISSLSTSASRPTLSPEIEKALATFRDNMVTNLIKTTKHAPQIIDAAIDRARGESNVNSIPGFEAMEKSLFAAVYNMINEIQAKQRNTTSASPAPARPSAPVSRPAPQAATVAKPTPTPSPAPTTSLEVEIQRRISNFRRFMLGSLQSKTNQAEAIIDSAIRRAQGLPTTGQVKDWETAEAAIVKSIQSVIADCRKMYALSSEPPTSSQKAAAPTTHVQSSQPLHQQALAPATLPGPAQPSAHAPNGASLTHANTKDPLSSQKPAAAPVANPAIPVPSPASLRTIPPSVKPTPRPPAAFSNPASASTLPSAVQQPTPIPNVSSPAPPSAGVLAQITAKKCSFNEMLGNTNGNRAVEQVEQNPAKTPTSAPNGSGPAPRRADVDQIAKRERSSDRELGKAVTGEHPKPERASTPPPIVVERAVEQQLQSEDGPPKASVEQPQIKDVPISTFVDAELKMGETRASDHEASKLRADRLEQDQPIISNSDIDRDEPMPTVAAPTGIANQVVGKKRSLSEGPGCSGADQPESKKLAMTPA